MESTARGNRKPEITKESAAAEKNPPQSAKRDEKLHAQRDSCGAFLPFNERFSSLAVPKPVWFSNAVWANIRPNILAQEVLKEHSFCYELVWTKERSSIGGVIVQEIGGSCRYQRGEIQSSCFFRMVSTANKGAPRAQPRDASGAVVRSVSCLRGRTMGKNEIVQCPAIDQP